jgi:uncharacterized protein (DUF2249 family)
VGPDDRLLIACDYEPEMLRWHVEGWCPVDYRWSWKGPLVWRADITRQG